MLEAPEAARRKKRQRYAYLGGGQMSVASSMLLQNIVVKTKTWHMGVCYRGVHFAQPNVRG